MSRIDAIIFDLDDTLLTTRDAFSHAMAAVSKEYGLQGDPVEIARMWRNDPSGYYHRFTLGQLTLAEQRRARVNELHAAFGGPSVDQDEYARWEEIFVPAFVAGTALHADVPAALAFVAARGWPSGIVSNAPRELQLRKMAQVGLEMPFLVGMELGVGKPDPRVFLAGVSRLGADPAHTVYVGDEFDTDAHGAMRAGLQAVWLDRPDHRRAEVTPAQYQAAPFPIITSLDQLADAVS